MHRSPLARLVIALSVIALSACAPGPDQGVSFARPGSEAVVRLELRSGANIAFRHVSPNVVRLVRPFGAPLVQRRLEGEFWPEDREYYQHVAPLEFRFAVPDGAQPGRYRLRFTGELFVCDKVVRVCFKQKLETAAELRVGESGEDRATRLDVGLPAAPGGG